MIRAERVAVTTTGSAGSASGNADSGKFAGEILGFWIDYHASAPAGTTDITITDKLSGQTLYAKTNSVTDVFIPLRVFALDKAGSALASDVSPQCYAVGGGINVAIAQCDALTDAAVVYVVYRT